MRNLNMVLFISVLWTRDRETNFRNLRALFQCANNRVLEIQVKTRFLVWSDWSAALKLEGCFTVHTKRTLVQQHYSSISRNTL